MKHTPNFNRLARIYRWLEYVTFGPILQRCRVQFLPTLASPHQALILGDGDGRFTARLLLHHPATQVDAVDASPAMLQALLRRTQSPASLTIHCADARHWQPARPNYDLIATHFFLDCLTTSEAASLAQRLTQATTPNAHWLVSEFATPPTFLGRAVATPLVFLLYRAFRFLTGLEPQSLPDYRTALKQAGWALDAEHTRLKGLLVSQRWRKIAEQSIYRK